MAADPSPHLPDELVRRYAQGQLESAEAARLVLHLRDCANCLGRLKGLAPPDFMARHCPTLAAEEPAPGQTIPAGSTRTDWAGDAAAPDSESRRELDLTHHPEYDIIRVLGRGGMGVVYLAHNKLMGRDEVLKSLDHDIIEQPAMQDRFLREIRAVARLRHPNIVAAYTAFESGESLVFAMEYVEGLDLARMVRAKGPMPVGHACYFVYQAALALQHAHEEGMVHRDIKPGNLMLSHTKGRALVKVLDFGLSKANRELKALDYRRAAVTRDQPFDTELTQAGQFLGTPGFIAPEQIADAQKADIRADIYSLGCTLYFLLSGHAPFPMTSLFDVIHAHRTKSATPLDLVRPDVPAELAAVVAKMMEKQPDQRFQTPAAVAEALMPFFKKRDAPAAPTLPGPARTGAPDRDLTPTEPSFSSPDASAGAGAGHSPSETESMWEKLIEFDDDELDSPGPLSNSTLTVIHPAWFRPMVAGLAGAAAIVLVAGLMIFGSRTEREQVVVEAKSTDRGGRLHDEDQTGRSALARTLAPQPATDRDQAPTSVSSQREELPVASSASPAQPDPFGPTALDRKPEPLKLVPRSVPPMIKARRWNWIHDASVPVFDRWVENVRARGYRPTFVNGHDLASQVHVYGEPDAPGNVRTAAIAVNDDRRIAFQVALDPVEKGFPHYLELVARGYGLTAMTTFTNGTMPEVLAVYTENGQGAAYWNIGSSKFPGDYVGEWHNKGARPFSVSCRPVGDFWAVNLGTKDSKGVDWKLHLELSLDQLDKLLVEAKTNGFRPDSLFVCPGTAHGGFGVVLTHDDPSLLWEVRANLSSAQLEPALGRMAEKGYGPDQVVGSSRDGVSRYVVCWTRNPAQYPATGLTEPALEPLDIALEQFLVEHRIPNATMAVYRNGRLAMSRGFGHTDEKTGEPLSPTATMSLAGLSAPLAAAAVHSLVRKKKLSEDTKLSDLLGAPEGDTSEKPRPAAPGLEPPLTLGRLLGRLDDSAPEFDKNERETLSALAVDTNNPGTGPVLATDLDLQGAVLGRILQGATTKSASEAIAAELSHVVRLSQAAPDLMSATKPPRLFTLAAPATEVGRFFLKNQFDGRPLAQRAKSKAGVLIGREGSSLAMIQRRDDLLVVVMMSLPEEAPPELGDTLSKRLGAAVESLAPPISTPGKRKASLR